MALVSIVTPCYNEEANVEELRRRVAAVFDGLTGVQHEHIFIDNASRDNTLGVLKSMAVGDARVKVIANARNFGHLRSPMHAMFQASGDAVALIFADLQDPPELLLDMVLAWQRGVPVVLGIKNTSQENGWMFWIRTQYYRAVNRLTNIQTYENFTGFGLFDRRVMEILRSFGDQYPYFRGMIAEVGLPYEKVLYEQKRRARGITKNNFYTLYDLAMLGITNLSKVPLRFAVGFGFACALVSVAVSLVYFVYKLVFWNSFTLGIAPIAIGLFFFASVQLLSVGILGEYIGAIHTQVLKRPLVVERERINFGHASGGPEIARPMRPLKGDWPCDPEASPWRQRDRPTTRSPPEMHRLAPTDCIEKWPFVFESGAPKPLERGGSAPTRPSGDAPRKRLFEIGYPFSGRGQLVQQAIGAGVIQSRHGTDWSRLGTQTWRGAAQPRQQCSQATDRLIGGWKRHLDRE